MKKQVKIKHRRIRLSSLQDIQQDQSTYMSWMWLVLLSFLVNNPSQVEKK